MQGQIIFVGRERESKDDASLKAVRRKLTMLTLILKSRTVSANENTEQSEIVVRIISIS